MSGEPYGLFEVIGIELEYMIVDADDLSVRPIADELIRAQSGAYESEIEVGPIAWSNELVLHVIEFKTNGPAASVEGLPGAFSSSVQRANELLGPMNARLMPTSMHPWMDPGTEMRLWPHEYNPIYERFHEIFDCRGHGWANLQSTHINLPFRGDDEFGRLHAAIRLVLPILPALAASSPVASGRSTGMMDTRMKHYGANSRRVPSVAGALIPEPVFRRDDYETVILGRIYEDLGPHDPEGILRHEWANARGCIARFDRSAIEIRVLDIQESPRADLSIAAAVVAVVRALVDERLAPRAEQEGWEHGRLAAVLEQTVREAGEAVIREPEYLRLLGLRSVRACSARELWEHLLEGVVLDDRWRPALDVVLREGCLARRIVRSLGGDLRRERLREVYAELCRCLARDEMFRA